MVQSWWCWTHTHCFCKRIRPLLLSSTWAILPSTWGSPLGLWLGYRQIDSIGLRSDFTLRIRLTRSWESKLGLVKEERGRLYASKIATLSLVESFLTIFNLSPTARCCLHRSMRNNERSSGVLRFHWIAAKMAIFSRSMSCRPNHRWNHGPIITAYIDSNLLVSIVHLKWCQLWFRNCYMNWSARGGPGR